jgi:hypothetical protein
MLANIKMQECRENASFPFIACPYCISVGHQEMELGASLSGLSYFSRGRLGAFLYSSSVIFILPTFLLMIIDVQ